MTLELVLTPLILAALTVLSTVVGVWDKISSRARNAVILASILILTSVMSQIVQINEVRKQARTNEAQAVTNEKQAKIIEDKRVLIESLLKGVDEASGGAVDGPVAYIVDDNDPFIYVFEYVKAEGKYRPRDYKMKIVDARPCSNRSIFWELEECNEAIFTELTQPIIRDLEGVALHDGKLYLTTSQSSTENRNSWKFLRTERFFERPGISQARFSTY